MIYLNALVSLCALVMLLVSGCAAGPMGGGSPSEISTQQRLGQDVRTMVGVYPARNATNRGQLNACGRWLGDRFGAMGYEVVYEPVYMADGTEAFNVVAELRGVVHPDEIVVVGAHYDAEVRTPGADDNASGVAVLLELARRFAGVGQERTIRWIAFTNEENSNSRGGLMGSFVHARDARVRGEEITSMLSLEMLGYFDDAPGSQRYPFDPAMAAQLGMELPTTGDFIGVVGRIADRELIEQLGSAMAAAGTIPVTPAPLPAMVRAIWRSDHGGFWMAGYHAVMITDTSEYRNAHYHKPGDLPETLDFERMAGAAVALETGIRSISRRGVEDPVAVD